MVAKLEEGRSHSGCQAMLMTQSPHWVSDLMTGIYFVLKPRLDIWPFSFQALKSEFYGTTKNITALPCEHWTLPNTLSYRFILTASHFLSILASRECVSEHCLSCPSIDKIILDSSCCNVIGVYDLAFLPVSRVLACRISARPTFSAFPNRRFGFRTWKQSKLGPA